MLKLVIVYCTFISFLAISKEYSKLELIHPVIGCPENSLCNAKSGKNFLKWTHFLQSKNLNHQKIQKFNEKNGLPVLTLSIDLKNHHAAATWKSSCKMYRDQKPEIWKSQVFLKNTHNLEKKGVFFKPIIIDSGKKLKTYHIPLESFPVQVRKKSVLLGINFDQLAINLEIFQKRNWKVHSYKNFVPPTRVNCNKKLIKKAKEIDSKIYKNYQCYIFFKEKIEFLIFNEC